MLNPELKRLISQGETGDAIALLVDFAEKYYTNFAEEIYVTSSRFKQVSKDNRMGVIPVSDYQREMNSITSSLFNLSNSLEGLSEANFKLKKTKDEIVKRIKELDNEFDESRKKSKTIQSNPSRLRQKNALARELGEIFISHPNLIQNYFNTSLEGIICGIAYRYKRIPELKAIDFFESVIAQDLGNFTKCCIVNALGELIYSGQLLVGDDRRITFILDQLFPGSYQTVKLSITKVSGELDYFIGNVLSLK